MIRISIADIMRSSSWPATALSALCALLLSTTVLAQVTVSKYCSPESPTVCFTQISRTAAIPIYRIAMPDVTTAPFETILQIVSPITNTWVGFAWGGGMVNNPITMAWMNGNTAVVSSRWASDRNVPQMYSQATVRALASSRNATHWTAEIHCTGCSRWTGGQITPEYNNQFAWGSSRNPVPQPANPSSTFPKHQNVGMFGTNLVQGKTPTAAFNAYKNRVVNQEQFGLRR